MSDYVLGIDAGTESIRAAIFNEKGICLSSGNSDNKSIHSQPGWAEQLVISWENSLVEAINKAIAKSDIKPDKIKGISIDGTSCTVVFLDREGKPLRNAIMWMDVRAYKEAEEVASSRDPALKYVGFGNVSPEWFPCKLLWIKRHEPIVYEKARTIFEQTDWLVYTLTGELTTNINTTSIRWFYDSSQGGLPKSLYNTIGLGDIFDKLPSRLLKLGEVAGILNSKIAGKTGLKVGIPVATGGADAFIGIIGINALKPGKMALITGSSHVQIGLLDKIIHSPGIFGTYPDAVLPGYQVVEAGQVSTGSVIKWFKDNFINCAIEKKVKETSGNVYEILNVEAQKVPVGSEGLIVLEHWQGNRTPWVDPSSRGVIRGLTLHHTPYHVFRAIMEGVAYGTSVILQKMEGEGVIIEELVACGGATNSDLWMQIHADVTGKIITITEEQQAVTLGGAILATVGAGIYSSIQEAAEQMVRLKKVIEPNMGKNREYQFYIDQYVKTYENLKEESKKAVRRLETSCIR